MEATKKQLWALYCATKKDYRNSGLTKDEASKILSELMENKPKANKPVEVKISLKEELLNYLTANISKIVESAKESLKIESVVMNDTRFMKDDGKRYAFVGYGCAFVWIEFDKRSKKANEIYRLSREIRNEFANTFEKQFDKKVVNYYDNIGCPLKALFRHDENIQNAYFWLVTEFMKYKGIKNAYVMSRLD